MINKQINNDKCLYFSNTIEVRINLLKLNRSNINNLKMNPKLKAQRIKTRNKLIIICCFSFTFMLIEFAGGVWSNSIAIISDGLHMGSDVIGYFMQTLASFYAIQGSTSVYTFGKQRSELIGGLFNCFVIWTLTIYLIVESILRYFNIS